MNKLDAIIEYARNNYKKMFREAEGQLKHKFIVPGACYDNCLWDWDSWLTDIALSYFAEDDFSEYEKGCVLNSLDCIDEEGRIPIFVTGDRHFPDFSECGETNIHKPCLAQHAAFITKRYGDDAEWIRPHFDKILRFIDYYYNNCRHKNGLYIWIDDCAIGVDNDPCTFYRPKRSSASIFLNCMMYKELEAVCYLGDCLGVDISFYKNEMEKLRASVIENCYDEKDGFFYSADVNLLPIDLSQELHSGAPRKWDAIIQRIGCWSGFLAMWSGIATKEQAERMVKENLLDEKAFWAPYGVRTLSKYEKMYSIEKTNNPSCWLGPIWGISNYLVFEGLVKYGFDDAAKELAEKTVAMFSDDIAKSGTLHEYYNPESGEPIMNPDFQNWNLLSVKMGLWLKNQSK